MILIMMQHSIGIGKAVGPCGEISEISEISKIFGPTRGSFLSTRTIVQTYHRTWSRASAWSSIRLHNDAGAGTVVSEDVSSVAIYSMPAEPVAAAIWKHIKDPEYETPRKKSGCCRINPGSLPAGFSGCARQLS